MADLMWASYERQARVWNAFDRFVKRMERGTFITEEFLGHLATRSHAMREAWEIRTGAVSRYEGSYAEGFVWSVQHSWDVHFTGMEPDGATYPETETAGHEEWRFKSREMAEEFRLHLQACHGHEDDYHLDEVRRTYDP
ncbi:MAG: hypothetical protein GY871_08425, partial [Actinomycetales bacterium]|nr:hypothetical protein [Actinomycetales bacterium]